MRFSNAVFLLVVGATSIAGGCASGRGASANTRNPNLISTAEVDRARAEGVRDAYELVERLRPRWLQVRADPSFNLATALVVFHHETRLGGVDALRGYPLTTITSIRYLDAAQANLLPGGVGSGGHYEGAIVISTGTRGTNLP
jgi:hypothetical protein